MKIKNRIILSSFFTTILSMLLTFLAFYFFIFSEAKKERISVFEAKSINIVQQFSDFVNYYKVIVKKMAPSKEFVFLLDDNYFISSLSINSSKKLIQKIKNNEKLVNRVYILDENSKEIFDKKISIDIKSLVENGILIKKGQLFVYNYIGDTKGMLVFEINLLDLKKHKNHEDYIQHYLISSNSTILLNSDNFKADKQIKFSKKTILLNTNDNLYYSSPYGEYNVGTKVSKDALFKGVNTLFYVVLLSIIVITILTLIQSIKSSSILTSSIHKLIKVLETNADGKYSKITLKGDDEIEYFAKKYNEMIDRVSSFTHELEEKVKQRTKKIEKQKEKLKILSHTDTLTGVFNRNRLNEIVISREKYDVIYSIIIIDIDDFKVINDKHGHKVGDEILKEFATILKNSTRKSDFLGRWGGEEFIILCSDVEKEQAFVIAEEIREKIQNNNFYADLKLTASFGVSQYTKGISYDELFVLADNALLKAKKSGKNRVVSS